MNLIEFISQSRYKIYVNPERLGTTLIFDICEDLSDMYIKGIDTEIKSIQKDYLFEKEKELALQQIKDVYKKYGKEYKS